MLNDYLEENKTYLYCKSSFQIRACLEWHTMPLVDKMFNGILKMLNTVLVWMQKFI